MSRFLVGLLLLGLTGCAAGDRGFFKGSSGDENGASSNTETGDFAGGDLLPGTESLTGEEEAALLDPVTLEDMELLSGADQAPPEDEGETAVKDAVSFDLPVVDNAKVQYFVNYFTGSARGGFRRWLERSARYLPMMREVFAEEGLPLDLTYLAMIESGFNNRAVSSARATGPWQFMESTGRMYGLGNDYWHDERRDPFKATRAAARHLGDLYRRYDDWYLAMAAYNAGAGKVDRAIRNSGSRDFWTISHGRHLAKETKHYLPKMMAAMLIAKEPEKYGFTGLNYQPALECDVVKLPSSTDLDIIARLSGVSNDEIRNLNPELSRWCTPPNLTDYPVRLPAGSAESFQRKYAEIAPDRRANFRRHRIKSGDTLSGVAHRYGIRTRDIITLNKIRNPKALKIGRDLILPMQPGATLAAADFATADQVKNRPGSYKVRRGDNLWTISRRFGISTSQLCSQNGLRPSAILQPGKVLRIAGSGKGPVVSGTQGTTYKVRNGDNLWVISRRLGVSTSQLCALNDLRPSTILQPGQVLRVGGAAASNNGAGKKVVYQVRHGDTLWDIGRRFDLKTRDIMDWNNLKSSHVLQPGDSLTLLLANEQQS